MLSTLGKDYEHTKCTVNQTINRTTKLAISLAEVYQYTSVAIPLSYLFKLNNALMSMISKSELLNFLQIFINIWNIESWNISWWQVYMEEKCQFSLQFSKTWGFILNTNCKIKSYRRSESCSESGEGCKSSISISLGTCHIQFL